ncbi:MAG: hypothetical protein O3C63_04110 [Cyanobacteria bacterium]|nr:hypothetical protein [Cyanobacteriota bacterium]MDA1021414.1 hypothetical protein [Cyanobacteriota bacterium]
MARDPALENLCMALIAVLRSMDIADEMPTYLSSKAREINALAAHEALKKNIPDDAFQRLLDVRDKSRVSNDIDLATKEDLLKEMVRLKPAIERIKSSGFKLMLERFMSAHELAVYLSDVVDEILVQPKTKSV